MACGVVRWMDGRGGVVGRLGKWEAGRLVGGAGVRVQ